ncbi:hypothetical protein HH800_05700 [Sphingobium yanoikuyae]|uniref:Phage head morphogenesis domain-containing protein n=1 Tax=Sphingobium yanoikuyae TaxID=13690 RepID=A0A6M4G376_SPHYA|nr:phage minor head protein [Sphingobium yanoikuyae]QJR01731.1 hypothetical protein HH800_05700 [Sphingobium yanoikuyae]
MSFSLPRMARQAGKRRDIVLRPIIPTQAAAADLAAIYAPAWQIWADNIDRILAGYDPQPLPTADTLTVDTVDQVQAAISSVAQEFLTILTARIAPGLRNFAVRAERVHRSKFAASVKAGVGIDVDMLMSAQDVEETLGTFLARNAALVRNVSDQAQARISDAVFRGYQNRTPIRDVAKEIRSATGMGRTRATGIASDQVSKLSGALDTERMANAGISLWKYRHSGKLHPRSTHKERDGRIYTLNGNRQVNADGSKMSGGDVIEPGDEPSSPPWCGCRKQSYIPLLSKIE